MQILIAPVSSVQGRRHTRWPGSQSQFTVKGAEADAQAVSPTDIRPEQRKTTCSAVEEASSIEDRNTIPASVPVPWLLSGMFDTYKSQAVILGRELRFLELNYRGECGMQPTGCVAGQGSPTKTGHSL